MFPFEVWINILVYLPINDAGACTLASCHATGRCSLSEASLDPALWKPFYMRRYEHESRDKRFFGNWKEKYFSRRQLDREVLKHLDGIVEATTRIARVNHAREIINHGLNAWDVLHIVSRRPPPGLFQSEEDILKVREGFSLINLTRLYWAQEVLKILARRDAILRWSLVKASLRDPDLQCPSFEEAFSSLSSFHGVLGSDILKDVRRISMQCKDYLDEVGVPYFPEAGDYDVMKLCTAICQFMKTLDFARVAPDDFYDYRNSFPHLFLTTRRHSLPISLVFIFVAIAKSFGLKATPLDTLGRVVALVGTVFVDVFDMLVSIDHSASNFDFFSENAQRRLTAALLARASRNIIGALRRLQCDFDSLPPDLWHAKYTAHSLTLLFGVLERDPNWLANLAYMHQAFPLDLDLVIHDVLLPNIDATCRETCALACNSARNYVAEKHCYESECAANANEIRINDLNAATRLFIGQIVKYNPTGITGCITNVRVARRSSESDSIEYLYFMISFHPARYEFQVKREDLTVVRRFPSVVFRLAYGHSYLGQFFEDAEFIPTSEHEHTGIGRLIPSRYVSRLYPDDNRYGAHWIRAQSTSDSE